MLLRNVRVKSGVVDELFLENDLPYRAELVFIESVRLRLPWLNWASGTIELTINSLVVVVRPLGEEERNASEVTRHSYSHMA